MTHAAQIAGGSSASSTPTNGGGQADDVDIDSKIRFLGDPSGRQTSAYWDDWFRAVCVEDGSHRHFEWYVSSEEASAFLMHYLPHPGRSVDDAANGEVFRRDNINDRKAIIHVGSGNSLLPLRMRDDVGFPCGALRQVVIDVSEVALEEMRNFHDNLEMAVTNDSEISVPDSCSSHDEVCRIEYALGDVLSPPLPYGNDTFDAWVDKGLLDALFSGKDEELDGINSRLMLNEAHRLLKKGGHGSVNYGGVVAIISMAEEHSLRLILDNWSGKKTSGDEASEDCDWNFGGLWDSTLHVQELEPTSGNMRPFGFVMRARSIDGVRGSLIEPEVVLHRPDQGCVRIWPIHGTGIDRTTIQREVWAALEKSRKEFMMKAKETGERGAGKNGDIGENEKRRMLLAAIEINPVDVEVDLVSLCERITSPSWEGLVTQNDAIQKKRFRSLRWHSEGKGRINESSKPCGRVVPIGFGISKLVLECIIDSEDIDDLCDAILEQEGEEYVMSVRVDWDNTIQVNNVRNLHLPSE